MTGGKDKAELRTPVEGQPVSRDEILDVMADEGYTADDRKAWLKEVLTQVAQGQTTDSDPEREKLMQEIRDILHDHVTDDPEADDVS